MEETEEELEDGVVWLGEVGPKDLVDVDVRAVGDALALDADSAVFVAGDLAAALIVLEEHLGVAATGVADRINGGQGLHVAGSTDAAFVGEVSALLLVEVFDAGTERRRRDRLGGFGRTGRIEGMDFERRERNLNGNRPEWLIGARCGVVARREREQEVGHIVLGLAGRMHTDSVHGNDGYFAGAVHRCSRG